MNAIGDRHDDRRWWVLGVVGLAQLMVVVDATVVNVALPDAQQALHFSTELRQWVITAYALAFGSLLLLGGWIGDLFGRKWTFIGGALGFAVASAVGGAAQSFAMLRRRPRSTGCFRRDARPVLIGAVDHDVSRRSRPQASVCRLQLDHGRRRRGRAAAGLNPDRTAVLALQPVRQPRLRDPGRPRRAAAPGQRTSRRASGARSAGHCDGVRGAVLPGLRVLQRREHIPGQ